MQQLEERSSLLDAIVNMNDGVGLSSHDIKSDKPEHVESIRYESFALLDHLSVIKMEIDIIKERTKHVVDKKTQTQFSRIDKEIAKMTEHLIELRPQ
ncbi:MAG TPA: hypothetical protein VLB45_07335 [Nitrosopumilaceae archaeon]|nr:hypothetical protein [Nitrosopumilaceae archaeon]